MPNMKSLSLTVQNLWPRFLKVFLPQSHRFTESQTGQKLDAQEFHSGGIKIKLQTSCSNLSTNLSMVML